MVQEHQPFLVPARCFGFPFLAGVALGLCFCKGAIRCYHQDCLTFPVKHTCFATARFFVFMHVLGFDKRRGMCSWETLWTTAVVFIWQYLKGNYFSSSSIVITCLLFSLLLIAMNWKMLGREGFCFFLWPFCSLLTFEKSHFSPLYGFSKKWRNKVKVQSGEMKEMVQAY